MMPYYAELVFDGKITDSMSFIIQSANLPIILTGDANNVIITNISITTDCSVTGQVAECRCQENYTWSGPVCTLYPQCCLNKTFCSISVSDDTPMCLPKKRVTVRGTFILPDTYTEDLNDINSTAYIALKQKVGDQLKIHFSDLNEFDCVKIISFRIYSSTGNIIVEFVMLMNAPFTNKMLLDRMENASSSLNGTMMTVNTTGIVQMAIKEGNGNVKSEDQVVITCTLEDNTVKPKWFLSQKGESLEILPGNGVEFGSLGPVYDITILKTSENWGGIYTCEFSQGSITHKGFKTLHVALLPDYIVGVANPQFPDCRENGVIQVNSTCSIKKSNETYTVKWTNAISNLKVTEEVYTASTTVNCAAVADDITVMCSFENIMGQVKSQDINISVIKGDDNVCPKEGDWPLTKSGKMAVLQCADTEVGTRTRKCGESKWEESLEDCIDRKLYEVLQNALKLSEGLGNPKEVVSNLLADLAKIENTSTQISAAALNASLYILTLITSASMKTNTTFSGDVLTEYVGRASSLLDPSLTKTWKESTNKASDFLQTIENFAKLAYANNGSFSKKFQNLELICSPILANKITEIQSAHAPVKMNVKINSPKATISTLAFFSLNSILPQNTMEGFGVNSKIQSITLVDAEPQGVEMQFQLENETSSKYKMMCVYWDFKANDGNGGWSGEGCRWDRQNSNLATSSCVCDHLTSFSVLMSKFPISLPWLDEIGYVGVGVSICSLMLCLIIEFLVWNSVVKSNISHFRHTALVNISLSLLIADCCFLSASFQGGKGGKLCLALAMAMHVSFLMMFFWMLCQSIMLLHQMIFLFQQLRKKIYLSFSFALGYLGPICIVIGTYMKNPNKYHSKDSCWLIYEGGINGSIFAFVLPVGIIVIINTFTLVVVISKLLRPSVSEGDKVDAKENVKSIMKAVIILTPVFGLTWALGFLTLIFDLPETFGAMAVHYSFSILNSFQVCTNDLIC
ncbi:adhesion G-protein coupled receptor F1-like [Acipenser oxyrinchus oxyrinchus]|uniref:Adhesion G-protein coupled receptor F1-like n=1 Tax=Acipenser oxyrinchus oxyrinchus TaxID=40147 RepID=A0AAD8G9R0_ACIOX|nr:adhesion G-protein coupled receptor F1-like [Acipenser oxyrinchus oxyrinchus]